ncbi:MAG: PA0069 family radical SAM protein [Gammaproteobacteria bacterium]|nr:PA0069 family radical SAM protein [Gammaproteobacteria bacterium]
MGSGMRGRAACGNPPGRFARTRVEQLDDGWYREAAPDSIATSVAPDAARSVISRNDSPDLPFEQSINPYRGCEHGCIYCYARPSHAYLDLSPGLDFETRLYYKRDAAERLRAELGRPGYRCAPLALGTNTDPYQPIERRLGVTRSILELLLELRHPCTIVTKSVLVLRDLDLLTALAARHLTQVFVSITTLDADLKRTLEPRAAAPAARLRALAELHAAGIPVGVLIAPVIPAVNDAEIERIVEQAAAAGAASVACMPLRLPHEVAGLFRDWLQRHLPERAAHVMALVRAMRGGRDNDARFGARMRGSGPLAELLARRCELACGRHGIAARGLARLDTRAFRAPHPAKQLNLALS